MIRSSNAKIVIGGDLNDPPSSVSVSDVLNSRCYQIGDTVHNNRLYNLSCHAHPGTHKNRGIWETIDQFIVTGNLINPGGNKKTPRAVYELFSPGFLLENDEKYSGYKPIRTWEGRKYKGGFSDHLPIILSIY